MPTPANYDESLVPVYDLPDPLVDAAGGTVSTAADWRDRRRGEILRLFEDHVYGRMPGPWEGSCSQFLDEDGRALDGLAVRRQTRVRFGDGETAPAMDVLLYLPCDAKEPVPVFLGLNFYGNHSIQADPGIHLSTSWMRDSKTHRTADHRASEGSRGTAAMRWPVDGILARGFGLATIYCGDLDPDFDDGYANGVHPLFYAAGQSRPEAHQWGSLGAWAWGLSRGLDVLQQDARVDATRICVMGHSRLGKTALWAGACDERFALVISNNSGCGGAALCRRRYGETVEIINDAFPHWFCDNHRAFDGCEDELPVDQHELVALAAPRPVYVTSAIDDRWADPKGEFLAALHAGPVYELLGERGLDTLQMPSVDDPLTGGRIGYHVRRGGHDVTAYDWDRWMDFADLHLRL
jgi:hypothetical protein